MWRDAALHVACCMRCCVLQNACNGVMWAIGLSCRHAVLLCRRVVMERPAMVQQHSPKLAFWAVAIVLQLTESVLMQAQTHTHTRTHADTHTSARRAHTHAHTRAHTHTHMHKHTQAHAHARAHTHTPTGVRKHTRTRARVHTRCELRIADCTLHTSFCMSHVACRTLHFACCMSHVACRTLHVARCMSHVACCTPPRPFPVQSVRQAPLVLYPLKFCAYMIALWRPVALGLPPPRPATSAPALGSTWPHLRRAWAHPCHICSGTGLTPAHICTWTHWTHPCRRPVADHPVPRLRRGCGAWRSVRCRRARTRSRCAGGSASSCRCVACNARMLQRAVLCCSSVFCVAADCTALHQIVLCCSRLYYVASNCTVLHRGAWQDHEPHIFACLRMTAHATHSGARSLLWTPAWFRWPTVWAENDGCAECPLSTP
jgi:hypothetical protein